VAALEKRRAEAGAVAACRPVVQRMVGIIFIPLVEPEGGRHSIVQAGRTGSSRGRRHLRNSQMGLCVMRNPAEAAGGRHSSVRNAQRQQENRAAAGAARKAAQAAVARAQRRGSARWFITGSPQTSIEAASKPSGASSPRRGSGRCYPR